MSHADKPRAAMQPHFDVLASILAYFHANGMSEDEQRLDATITAFSKALTPSTDAAIIERCAEIAERARTRIGMASPDALIGGIIIAIRSLKSTISSGEPSIAESALNDLRRVNEAGFKEAYRMLGIEDDGEYRWKWLLLELSKLTRPEGTPHKHEPRIVPHDETHDYAAPQESPGSTSGEATRRIADVPATAAPIQESWEGYHHDHFNAAPQESRPKGESKVAEHAFPPAVAAPHAREYNEKKAVMLLRDIVGRGLLDVYPTSKLAVERYLAGYDYFRKHNPGGEALSATALSDEQKALREVVEWLDDPLVRQCLEVGPRLMISHPHLGVDVPPEFSAKAGAMWKRVRELASRSATPRAQSPVTHVICFEGEGAEVVLCRGWGDCRARFFNGIFGEGRDEWDMEQVRYWDADFANDDNWNHDESGRRYCFTSDIGEISKVRIYCLAENNAPDRSGA